MTESLIRREEVVDLPTEFGQFRLYSHRECGTDQLHLALVKGEWKAGDPILVRVHSSCVTGDIFGSCRCDCGPQLHTAMQMIDKEGRGLVLYMFQEGRGIGLANKLKTYHLQEMGRDTIEANVELGFKPDERDYGIGAQILRDLGATNIRLITNNPTKKAGLTGYGIQIVENIPLRIKPNEYNQFYLKTKQTKMGHSLDLDEQGK